jgi:hypothetical protein
LFPAFHETLQVKSELQKKFSIRKGPQKVKQYLTLISSQNFHGNLKYQQNKTEMIQNLV